MNKIEFKIEKFDPKGDQMLEVVGIYIDDKNLVDIITEFEKKFTDQPGGYTGDIPQFFVQKMQFDYAKDIAILISSDSFDEDDWPIKMNYETSNNCVVWHDLRNPWREDQWDYASLPEFKFDKILYRQEIQKIYDYCKEKEGSKFEEFIKKTSSAVRKYNNAGFIQ